MTDPVPNARRSPMEHERDLGDPIRTPAEALKAERKEHARAVRAVSASIQPVPDDEALVEIATRVTGRLTGRWEPDPEVLAALRKAGRCDE